MKKRVPATWYHTLGCAITVEVHGLSVLGQELAECSVLSANPGAGILLWTSPRLGAPSAQCTCHYQPEEFQLSRADKCRSPRTHGGECIRKKTSNLRFTSDPTQIIQKNKHFCSVKTKACALTLPKMQVFLFFLQSQEHCSCYFGSRESIPTLRRHSAQFISCINPVSYARDNLAHIALS